MKHSILILIAALTLTSCNLFSSSDKYDGNYREACRNMDFEAAHKILDKMVEENKGSSLFGEDQEVIEATDYIFNAESLYLVSQNTSEANTRVVYLLSELPMKGRAMPEGSEISDIDELDGDGGYTSYISYANRYNSKCLAILNTAISVGNQEVAEKILSMIKDDASSITKKEKKVYGDPDDGNYDEEEKSYVHYTTDSKDKAKKLYEQAVQEGKFK